LYLLEMFAMVVRSLLQPYISLQANLVVMASKPHAQRWAQAQARRR
jgi:hypothetical protein